MKGDIDGRSAVEGDGWQILIEEGLEHDDFISMLKEGGENGILSCKNPKRQTDRMKLDEP
jgi:hypothetical protein